MSNSSGDSNATLLGARALDDEPMISGIFVFMGFAAVVFVCVIVSHVAISNAQRETEWQQRAALAEEEVTPIDLKLAIGFTVAIGIAAFSTLPEPESSKHGGEH